MKKVKIRKSPALEKMKKFQAEKVWRKDTMKIAIRILHILEEKGMTQRDLADHLGKSPQWVNKICKGQQNLTIGTINELQEALGVTLMEISKRKGGTIPVEINRTEFRYTALTQIGKAKVIQLEATFQMNEEQELQII